MCSETLQAAVEGGCLLPCSYLAVLRARKWVMSGCFFWAKVLLPTGQCWKVAAEKRPRPPVQDYPLAEENAHDFLTGFNPIQCLQVTSAEDTFFL